MTFQATDESSVSSDSPSDLPTNNELFPGLDDDNPDESGGDADHPVSQAKRELQELVLKENAAVYRWRDIATVLLVITAALVTWATFSTSRQQEEDRFATVLLAKADHLLDESAHSLANMAENLRAMGDVVTTYAMAPGPTTFGGGREQPWPLLTLPNFERHAKHVKPIKELGSTAVVWMANVVDFGERSIWEAYGSTIQCQVDNVLSPCPTKDEYAPVHQLFPHVNSTNVTYSPENYDMFADPELATMYDAPSSSREVTVSGLVEAKVFRDCFPERIQDKEKISLMVHPIYQTLREDSDVVVGYLHTVVHWGDLFAKLLPEGNPGVYIVLSDSCRRDPGFTFLVSSNVVQNVGEGNLHDKKYSSYMESTTLPFGSWNDTRYCTFEVQVYPSTEMRVEYETGKPLRYTLTMTGIFMAVATSFLVYNMFVTRRNNKIMKAAVYTVALLSDLFPRAVRDNLIRHQVEREKKMKDRALSQGLRGYLRNDVTDFSTDQTDVSRLSGGFDTSRPIADLFPETTVLFADLAGFTAWSSVREPFQVFILLETLYHAFDAIAKRRRIFKVETIGDCYVAASGIPEPKRDHAVSMAKFAREIMRKCSVIVKQLEVSLGPDTGDLSLRIGIHSGPVTAGVLRGDKCRFQLFGDTMKVASRMESTGEKGKIQVSQETADLMIASGKGGMVSSREEKIYAKGKGGLQTYWLLLDRWTGDSSVSTGDSNDHASVASSLYLKSPKKDGASSTHPVVKKISKKDERLIQWNVEILSKLLGSIIATRRKVSPNGTCLSDWPSSHGDEDDGGIPFDEVKEIICLPAYNDAMEAEDDSINRNIPPKVLEQLRDFVAAIANLYNDSFFHNFEHASHVVMSVSKLLSRIVAPRVLLDNADISESDLVEQLHNFTFGITSDPLTQFAVMFAALVHDCDHSGVPNARLITENDYLADRYNSKSVAEQNSIDLAWDLLTEEKFSDLRLAICGTSAELKRFRQLVINCILATDLADKELKNLRNSRWVKAFSDTHLESGKAAVDRKATIVIEHLIQASDVAHTMQHWHVYAKWNAKLFMEQYQAYVDGRASHDPSETWYEGEIGFFDHYVIPLAKKLKECGVFGVSSEEYLNYAVKNRAEWEQKGHAVVAQMLSQVANVTTVNSEAERRETKRGIVRRLSKAGLSSS